MAVDTGNACRVCNQNMKVLYAALRNDPRDPDRASGVDYNFYTAILAQGHEVRIVGPIRATMSLGEKGIKKAHDLLFHQRYLKWDWASIRLSSRLTSQAAEEWGADLVFSIFPAPLAFYTGKAAAVLNTDLAFKVWNKNGGGFSPLATKVLSWIEGRAIGNSARVILFSDFWREQMIRIHGTSAEKLRVMAMPAALPSRAVPHQIEVRLLKQLTSPLRLLLVGKDFHRKGVDIALETVQRLNEEGMPAHLTVCATSGPAAPYTQYVGPFRKSDPAQLEQYVSLYRQAHLLLHPARFEPAGIVPGEAAAFGTPTITNNYGGLGTTVKDGVSGLVLPAHSPAEAYVAAVKRLIESPEAYYALCEQTRQRYEQELNWESAGTIVNQIFLEAIQTPHNS